MLKKVVQTGGALVTGVVIDRMAQKPAEPKPAPGGIAPFRQGDTVLDGLSKKAQLDSEAPSAVLKGSMSQLDNRRGVADKLLTIAKHPERAAEHASKMADDVKSDVEFLHGAAKIAQGGQLTTKDGARLAKAAVESTENSVVAAVRGLYAGATTSKEGVEDLTKTVTERAKYEGTAVAAGVAASQTIAAAVGMIPHPAAKVGAAAIRVSGQLAAGSKASEAAREIGGHVAGPVRTEIVAIAKEKSASDEG